MIDCPGNSKHLMFQVTVSHFCINQASRWEIDWLAVLEYTCTQALLAGITLGNDFFLFVKVLRYRVVLDLRLQCFEYLGVCLFPHKFCILLYQSPEVLRFGSQVGYKLSQVRVSSSYFFLFFPIFWAYSHFLLFLNWNLLFFLFFSWWSQNL